jgi:DNA-binding IclR family transcriptional regulator
MISYQNPHHSASAGDLPLAKKEKTDYIIQKVVQALNILEQFHDDVDELSVTELSKRLSLHESSVHLLVATLMARNYIEQNNSTGKYRLGFKTLELSQTVLRQIDLYRVAHPVLASIFAKCGENTAVAVLRKQHVIELDAIQCEQPVQVLSRVGVHFPVHCTAAGKALIALRPPDELEKLLGGMEFESFTPNTMTSADQLTSQLRQIAQNGFAIDDEERDRDVRGVAAAIYDYSGLAVGAVVITGPSCRVNLERINGELATLVQEGAREISAHLGFHEAEQPRLSGDLAGAEGEIAAPKKKRTSASARKPKEDGTHRAA